jgi:putative acetyltransferase
MAVSPEARGRGVGRMVVEAAIDHARASGARTLFLGSSKKLSNAVGLYESVGFKHVPRDTLPLTSNRIDVFMELILREG